MTRPVQTFNVISLPICLSMQFLNINLVITIEEKNSMSGQGCVELQYKYLDQKIKK